MKQKLTDFKNMISNLITHLGLRSKQLLFTLLCFLALVCFALVLMKLIYYSAKRTGLSNLKTSADSACDSLETETDLIYRNSIVILRNADIRTLLQDQLSEEDIPGLISIKNQAVSFVRVLDENAIIEGTRIYLQENRAFLLDQDLFYSFSDIKNEPWFIDFLSVKQKSRWIVLAPSESGMDPSETQASEGVFFLTRVVSTDQYDQTEALIRIDYSMEHLRQLLNYALISQDSGIALYGPDGQMISGSGSIFWTDQELQEILSGSHEGTLTTARGKTHYYLRSVNDTGWRLISCVPDRSFRALKNIRDFLPLLVIVIISWAGLLILSASYSAGIVRKIRKISAHVSRIQTENDVQMLTPFKYQDEFQALADSYNHMAETLKENLEREYLLGVSKRNSDLKALQAQINPHFLYNTLELIDYYAYENQPETVETIVKSLASFYKLSLNNGSDLYSLWKEIQLITSYIKIQNIRWESSIELETDIPDDLKQCQIPPFTLQPLVENSVLHGIRGNEKHKGRITIHARKEDNTVMITISDDGIGMKPELVNELNREMELISEDTVSGSHYGIQNSNQRLKIIFGPQYGMYVSSKENEGTEVSIIIPAS